MTVQTRELYTCSVSQERFWFLSRLEEQSQGAPNVHTAVRITGPLQTAVLRHAVEQLMARHDSLRTAFAITDGRLWQVVHPEAGLPFHVSDLRWLTDTKRDAELPRRAVAEVQRPFDLGSAPLLRVTLFRLADELYVLLVVAHEMVADRWSMSVFLDDLAALYEAGLNHRETRSEPSMQFWEFARWQRDWLQTQEVKTRAAYWRARLASITPSELPLDRARPAIQSLGGASRRARYSSGSAGRLEELSRSEEADMTLAMLAVFEAVLARYSEAGEVVVGMPATNRESARLAGVIGPLESNLVIRADVSGPISFRGLLRQAGRAQSEALARALPFERVIEELRPERDLSRTPLFQIMYDGRGAPALATKMADLDLEAWQVDVRTSRFDLALAFARADDGLDATVTYNPDLFEESTIDRLLAHVGVVLDAAIAEPDRRITDLQLLTNQERELHVIGWNATEVPYPATCLQDLVQAQVSHAGERVAVSFEGRQLTYAELNCRANQLAHWLRRQGVGPEVVVAVCMARSLDLVVALLAVLKSGGAFLPLDPEYPGERTRYMLRDSGARVLLTQAGLRDRLAEAGPVLLTLDEEWDAVVGESRANPASSALPANAAYVIYTSGSTGKPKGVIVEHRGICNRLLWMQDAFQLDESDRVLQKTSPSFDVSVWEFFWPLLAGARVILARPGGQREPSYLVDLIKREDVSTLHFVPSMLEAFVDEPGLERCSSLRRVMASGEALNAALAERFFDRLRCELHNLYGPTEASVDVSWWKCRRGQKQVPIGMPVANTTLYVLDRNLQPMAIGVTGELYIGGVQLARGYLGQPGLTAERFLPDPFSLEGGRLYRTGDMARRLADGSIEYLGRIDGQVKLRGNRVELGEIETVLKEHPAVKTAAVTLTDDDRGRRLLAFVVAAQDDVPAASLREYLSQRLPEFMVPSAFLKVAELPVTMSGKLNRSALPALGSADMLRGDVHVAPRTPTEELVATIWEEVLHTERVGAHDNFFELGGHSLLATRVVSRVREALDVEVPLRTCFERPTAGGLAAAVDSMRESGAGRQPPPIRPQPASAVSRASFGQERLWFLNGFLGAGATYNVPRLLQLRGRLDHEDLNAALKEIVRRHEPLRTGFVNRDGRPLALVQPAMPVIVPMTDLSLLPLEVAREEAQRLALEAATESFDLSKPPLLRARLLCVREDEHWLLLVAHHIACDGWSMSVLQDELTALYNSRHRGLPLELPETPLRYSDFSAWQRGWLAGEAGERQLAYWRDRLRGAPQLLELPADRTRPAIQSFRGGHHSFTVAKTLREALRRSCRAEGATLFMVLMAAFQSLLHRYTDSPEVSIGFPVAGRDDPQLEPLVGMLVNMLVVRTDFSGKPSFNEVVRRVREGFLSSYEHRHVPFEQVVEAVQPERTLAYNPLFQVALAMQTMPQPEVTLDELNVTSIVLDTATAKFDLSLTAEEDDNHLRLTFEYNSDLFDHETVVRMGEHFQVLLTNALIDSRRPVEELELLPAHERQRLLEWSGGTEDLRPTASLATLFERRVLISGEAPAVSFGDQRLTYAQLNRRANRVAHALLRLGVGGEARVAIHLDRSLAQVVGIIGVLKAGAAFVPLDPAYPAQRLRFMLEDSRSTVVLKSGNLSHEWLPEGVPVLDVDGIAAGAGGADDLNPADSATALNAAYVMYTSGSTGTPKGVVVTHSNVVRLFAATMRWFDFSEVDVWTMFHSYAFDFSVWELWGALLHGGRLVVVPKAVSHDPSAFWQLLREQGVTVLNQTPSAFRHLMRAGDQLGMQHASTLRLIIFGGEALDIQALRPWFHQHGEDAPELVNMYGITETTVHVTYRRLHSSDADADTGSLIGRPIPDVCVLVLDRNGKLSPIGVVGELHVSGAGLARGYLGRAEMTAERFVPAPWTSEAGSRLYRSGDLGRWLANGELEYHGRADQQVKVRGFRIELGEVQAAISAVEGVKDTVVVAQTDARGDNRLVAYVTSSREPAVNPGDLLRRLRGLLPDYMVPGAIVPLDRLPLTENGKLDRSRLPRPALSQDQEGMAKGPATAVEEVLLGIWAGVLDLQGFGIDDNFFELGGDSIKAIQVVTESRRHGLQLTVHLLFECQTVRRLALAARATSGPAWTQPEPFAMVDSKDHAGLPEDAVDAYPMTAMQVGMLFEWDRYPDRAMYHNVDIFRVRTAFDRRTLEAAIDELIYQQPILRATFHLSGFSEPLQVVHREGHIPLAVDDDRALTQGAQERALDARLAREKADRGGSLERPPLRFRVQWRGQESFVLIMVEHHAYLDGWSVASLVTQLIRLYQARSTGTHFELPKTQIGFKDFVGLEREAVASPEHQAFWTERMRGAPRTLLPRLASAEYGTASGSTWRKPVAISDATSEALRRVVRTIGVPVKSILLAVHLTVHALLAGGDQVTTGVVFNGRPELPGSEDVLGLFLNTLPLSVSIARATWADLASRAFQAEQDILPYRRYPLSEVQRSAGGHPLFDSVFNYYAFHVFRGAGGLVWQTEPREGASLTETNFPLVANFSQNPFSSDLELVLDCDMSKLGEDQVEAIRGYYERALIGAATRPMELVDPSSLLSEPERSELLSRWNRTARSYVQETCVQMVERQVERNGSASAVEFGDQILTLVELNARANRLAHHLRQLAVGPEMVVGVHLERSLEMLVSLLAVLKAGASYLPLDPQYPAARLQFMMEDSRVAVLVTNSGLAKTIPVQDMTVVALDDHEHEIMRQSSTNPPPIARPDNLAYVIYTSGSTGRPKGVMVEHRSLSNFLNAMRELPGLSETDVLAAVTSLSFDIAALELFLPLITGSKVVILPREVVADGRLLSEALARSGATAMQATPATWTMLAHGGWSCPSGFLALCGGEALSRSLANRLLRDCALFNLYGPTETTIWSTVLRCREEGGPVPIGGPIANTEVYVLDARLRPVPMGVVGELYIGGVGVSRGYLRRPGLTAERFVPDPFSGQIGARLYRTGDQARIVRDGRIECLGRVDDQVKIRGFRVELAEIEAALSEVDGVIEAAASVYESEDGEKSIAAYLVLESRAARPLEVIRESLRERLPEHMIPSAFLVIDALPTTPNGKLDRHALPSPQAMVLGRRHSYVAPRNSVEEVLAAIWEEVLGVDRIGIDDDFFELGAHSLLATRVTSRMRQAFQVRVPMRALFEAPTVARLAERLLDDPELRPQIDERARHLVLLADQDSGAVDVSEAGARPDE